MERCDFSAVITIIRKYISDDHGMDQSDLLYVLFAAFTEDATNENYIFDPGQVCRWFNGQARISPRISKFYMESKKRKRLAGDIHSNVFPLLYDRAKVIQEVYYLVIHDRTISQPKKWELTRHYRSKKASRESAFIADVLCFAIQREFVKRDASGLRMISEGKLSPSVSEYIYGVDAPKPCRAFCGRDEEIENLHQMLISEEKVFLHGVAGIGKSELALAYAKTYKKEYTNVIYLAYTGDLKRDIMHMDFAEDLPNQDDDARFKMHHRFLRSLKEDTLLIIDNFDTTIMREPLLSAVMKYNCRIVFTTRSKFDVYACFELEEIQKRDSLFAIMKHFYSYASQGRDDLERIIEVVHGHTLAVELAARLLETGILEPNQLYTKLLIERAAMDAEDEVIVEKDGVRRKATYYDHIHTLFALFRLSDTEQKLMRNLCFLPVEGLPARMIAGLLKQRNMNGINGLIEKGFIQERTGKMLSVHPLVQEVAVEELKPTVNSCSMLLRSLQEICLRHGEDISCYKEMFRMIENIVIMIQNDDPELFLRFLEDVFPYMEKYNYEKGMQMIVKELQIHLKDKNVGTDSDRALLLDYQATCEENPKKALRLQRDAITKLGEITSENARLASNLYCNLSQAYLKNHQTEQAKDALEYAIQITEQYGLTEYHDAVVQAVNYAMLIGAEGSLESGIALLEKLSALIGEDNDNQRLDFAVIQETLGTLHLMSGDLERGQACLKKTLGIYERVFTDEPERIEQKKAEIMELHAMSGVYIGKRIKDKMK